MDIKLLTTSDSNNKLNKTYTENQTVQGTIKDGCSILSPEIIVKTNSLISSNYAYIADFGRYYFVEDPIIESQDIKTGEYVYRLAMSVDVLMSFNTGIKMLEVILEKQKNKNNSNMYINDGSFISENKSFNEIVPFNYGFSDAASYVLVTAGV